MITTTNERMITNFTKGHISLHGSHARRHQGHHVNDVLHLMLPPR